MTAAVDRAEDGRMRRMVVIVTGVLLVLGPMELAVAQSDGAEVSWFAQFMWAGDFLGLLIIWTLLAMSAFSIGFSVNLLMNYRRKKMMPEQTMKNIEVLLNNRQYRDAITEADNSRSYVCKIIAAALHEAPNGFVAMERAIEETSDNETVRVLRPLEYLNVLGNIAPMIGLFGTVYGMIRAFQELVAAGGNAEPGKLAAGISTALITTFWGLVVAVPALTAYAMIRNKVDAFASEAVLAAERLIAPFKPTPLAIQQARMQQAHLQAQIQAQAQAQVQARNQGSAMGMAAVQPGGQQTAPQGQEQGQGEGQAVQGQTAPQPQPQPQPQSQPQPQPQSVQVQTPQPMQSGQVQQPVQQSNVGGQVQQPVQQPNVGGQVQQPVQQPNVGGQVQQPVQQSNVGGQVQQGSLTQAVQTQQMQAQPMQVQAMPSSQGQESQMVQPQNQSVVGVQVQQPNGGMPYPQTQAMVGVVQGQETAVSEEVTAEVEAEPGDVQGDVQGGGRGMNGGVCRGRWGRKHACGCGE